MVCFTGHTSSQQYTNIEQFVADVYLCLGHAEGRWFGCEFSAE